mgnify:FL=1
MIGSPLYVVVSRFWGTICRGTPKAGRGALLYVRRNMARTQKNQFCVGLTRQPLNEEVRHDVVGASVGVPRAVARRCCDVAGDSGYSGGWG